VTTLLCRERTSPLSVAALLVLLGGGAVPAAAQDLQIPPVTYPQLPKQAAKAEGFVPAGWLLETRVAGDLNRDGVADLALVLRQNEPRNVIANENGLGANPLDTNPRILAVAFRDAASGSYTLQVENHTLVPRRDDPVLEDPLSETGGIGIERGALRVGLHEFASAGSWGMSTATFTFQFRNGQFVLIGYDRSWVIRNTGETKGISVNYLAGKMKLMTGNIASDNAKTVWRKVAQRSPPTIDRIGNGMNFDPIR
jgi:hypothetical protein